LLLSASRIPPDHRARKGLKAQQPWGKWPISRWASGTGVEHKPGFPLFSLCLEGLREAGSACYCLLSLGRSFDEAERVTEGIPRIIPARLRRVGPLEGPPGFGRHPIVGDSIVIPYSIIDGGAQLVDAEGIAERIPRIITTRLDWVAEDVGWVGYERCDIVRQVLAHE